MFYLERILFYFFPVSGFFLLRLVGGEWLRREYFPGENVRLLRDSRDDIRRVFNGTTFSGEQ